MSRTQSRPVSHDYEIGELVTLAVEVAGISGRVVCQVLGFRKETKLRLLPLGGVPIVAEVDLVRRCGLPAGSSKPPQRRRRYQRRRKKQAA